MLNQYLTHTYQYLTNTYMIIPDLTGLKSISSFPTPVCLKHSRIFATAMRSKFHYLLKFSMGET